MAENDDLPPNAEGAGQAPGPAEPAPLPAGAAPLAGRRQALTQVRRQLSDEELGSPGVQKLILDDWEQCEGERAELKVYVERYYAAERRAAVLEERVKAGTALEILFGVGVGVGSAIIGLAPFFFEQKRPGQGGLAIALGFILVVGSTIARIVKR